MFKQLLEPTHLYKIRISGKYAQSATIHMLGMDPESLDIVELFLR